MPLYPNHTIVRSLQWILRLSNVWTITIGIGSLIVTGVVDYMTGFNVSVFLFYFFPVLIVTWKMGSRYGFLFSGLGSLTYILSHMLVSPENLDHKILYWNSVMSFFILVGISLIISLLKETMQEALLARVDNLTGVANGRALEEVAENEIRKAQRYLRPMTFVYLDLDNFKAVNDAMGHTTGNLVLRTVAQTIKKHIRGSDMVGRIGGDEFAILLPETDDRMAGKILQRLKEAVSEVMTEMRLPVTLSMGAVTFKSPPASVDEMYRTGDTLMYQAKQLGKDKILQETVL